MAGLDSSQDGRHRFIRDQSDVDVVQISLSEFILLLFLDVIELTIAKLVLFEIGIGFVSIY